MIRGTLLAVEHMRKDKGGNGGLVVNVASAAGTDISVVITGCIFDYEIFSTVILSLPLIQEGQLSVSGERMCTILVNRLED